MDYQNRKMSGTQDNNATVEIPLTPITLQPQQISNPQNYSPHPPPYFQTQIVHLPAQNLGILIGLSSFTIKSSGKTTRYAADTENRQLFSYSSSVFASNSYGVLATLLFNDNNGTEFMAGDGDLSGYKIRSGATQLGVISPLNPYWMCCCGLTSLDAIITSGLGKLAFEPNSGCNGFGCCFTMCCKYGATFTISFNGQAIGKVTSSPDGGAAVSFPQDLDLRIKGVLIAGSFIMFNLYFS